MSLRDLVSGGDVCTPSDVGGPSNAVGTLTNALLGKSKVQDSVLEVNDEKRRMCCTGVGFTQAEHHG